jgi:outer membrane protein assembly complex protein YaeT
MEGLFQMNGTTPVQAFATRAATGFICVAVLFWNPATCSAAPAEEKVVAAKLSVSGYGILGNFELKRILRTLELSGKRPQYFGPAFIEDSALILTSRVKRDGYLKPVIKVRLRLKDGSQKEVNAEELVDNPLPRSLLATRAEFRIHKGLLYHYEKLEFEGLKTMTDRQARSFFMETAILLRPQSARVFTPQRLRQGLSSLTEVLERDGYQDAVVETNRVVQDDKTGHVFVQIHVSQGPRSMVESVAKDFLFEEEGPTNAPRGNLTNSIAHPNRPYSRIWAQDFSQAIKTNLFRFGYPDASVELNVVNKRQEGNTAWLDLEATAKSGPFVRVGTVDFTGEKRTKEKTMARRVRIKDGDPLDRIKVEEGRFRLAQLGSFDTVESMYLPVDEDTWDVIYRVKEGKSLDVSLLFGYGSYELLRGGFEIEKNNIWGLGHHARLKAIQSFKATIGDFLYTVPDFVGDVDLFFNGNGLRREEVDFTRVEYGGGFGAHRYFKDYATDVSARYSYQILDANNVPGVVSSVGPTNTPVGSIITDIKQDRRDNPLYPRHGYKVFVNFELASQYLGGEANYQRLEVSAAWHHSLGGGRYLGLGMTHGLVLSGGDAAENLPFNKRFFPGGENSIRGYREGEAAPKDAQGQIVGAETFTLGTVELEQALTPKWSFVIFSDSLGEAQNAADYPFDIGLFSVGGGIRLKTIIGPMRLEYGYNLNPRKGDPVGTLQFSLGFPF